MASPDGGTLGADLGTREAAAAPPEPLPKSGPFQAAVTDVYDSFCAPQAGGRAYCPTQGRCFDPLTETCREPGYTTPSDLPECIRGAQARCRSKYAGDAFHACAEGTTQSQRAPTLSTDAAAKAMLLFPLPFAYGGALAGQLCSTLGGGVL